MKLGQGITTVVGPNGCGKTNIVDAIRWVLGEQKYSILRSGKMEDVIFNGSEGTKPLGVCEVSMVVHNNSGKLPIEYNDVEIARRVYRSGESEYYLNKTQCRLKDIMNLFVDTGMGADAYSVIELKMIEQILSETADERRKMFEEAAGIHKYRTQKKSTIRRFEATRNDLERVQDIIAEVEQKVHHLELQLKRFKRHANLTETIETRDKELAYLQVHRFKSLIAPLQARIKEYTAIRETKSSESSVYQRELEQLQDTYKTQDKELKELNNVMVEINDKRDLLRNNILINSEKGRGALLTIERLERESKNNYVKIESLKQLRLDFDKELVDLEPTIDEQLNNYKIKKEKFKEIEKNYQESVQTLDRVQNERWDIQRVISEDKSLYDRTSELIISKSSDIKILNEKIELFNNENVNHKKNHRILIDEKNNLEKLSSKTESTHVKIGNEIQLLRNEKDKLTEDKLITSASVKSLEEQKMFYNELLELKEGFPEGTRYVLENPKMFPGILGTIADVFQVDEKYRDALETGLGDLSHCLIAKDKSSAILALDKAREKDAGDITIIPLKEAAKLRSKPRKIPNSSVIIASASDIVKTSNQLKPLVEYLLGDLLIVNNLKDSIDSGNFIGWNLVDVNGAYYGHNLVLKNRQYSEHGYIIGRKEKLENINSQLAKGLDKEKDIEKKLSEISKRTKNKKVELEKLSIKLDEYRENISDIDMKILKVQMLMSQNDEQLNLSKDNLKLSKLDLEQAKKSLKSLEPEMKKYHDKLQKHEAVVEKANNVMMGFRKEKDDFQNSLQDIRIRLIELESRRDQLKFKRKSGKDTSNELKSRQQKIKDEIEDLQLKHNKLEQDIIETEKELNVVSAEINKHNSILDLKHSVYKETYQSIEELQARISNEQTNREKILEDLKNAELEANETEQKINIIKERIVERYNTTIPGNLVIDSSEEQLELEIRKMQKSIENIGPVNMAVQDEHSEAVERLETLEIQRDDLLNAEENLRETIRKIDKVARKRFQDTFHLIKTNFENLFNLFFEGGSASLRLSGDPDPLEADIAIDAQPPGKRNTSLRLLSSGEKALTAISLLFAIYQVKPSPYCILDEVDAPLDDVNIHKFTRVLGKFCDETQFIIVTHNKLTMEIADYMYGVTQEKKGISKLVSVKFD